MVVKRTENSICIENKHMSGVITKLELKVDEEREKEFSNWVEECAKTIKPCGKSIKDVEAYFLEKCDAIRMDRGDRRTANFLAGIVVSYFEDRLEKKAQSFSFEMSDEEIGSWSENNNARHREIRSLKQADLGIEIHGYVLERTKKNERFYDEAREEIQSLIDKGVLDGDHSEISEICFFFEAETESFKCTGGMNSLIDDLIVFHGVEAEDIEKRTTRFMAYVTSLRKLRSK